MTADEWNTLYPIGTRVVAFPSCRPDHPIAVAIRKSEAEGGFVDPRDADLARGLDTITRSRAWTLGNGSPVVAIDGYAGGISLTHIYPGGRCPECKATFEDCTCGGAR